MKKKRDVFFDNEPDMDRIIRTVCELLSRQDVGGYVYSYTVRKKRKRSECGTTAKARIGEKKAGAVTEEVGQEK